VGKFTQYLATGVLVIGAAPTALLAQEGQAETEGAAPSEIIVTATRIETRLQETPIAITAIPADVIEQSRIQNAADALLLVPNANFVVAKGGSASYASLRGAVTGDEAPGVDLPVTFFIDDIFYGSGATAYPDFYDVQQIEVLRGPQGTTFGRNVTGGAIVVRSKEPEDEFGASLSGTIGNDRRFEGRGYVTGPLGENLSGRISFSARDYAGYQKNIVNGNREGGQEFYSGRVMLKADLGADTRLLLNANGTIDRSNDAGFTFYVEGNGPSRPGFAGVPLSTDPDVSAGNVSPSMRRENFALSARLDHDFAFGTLTSITAYRTLDSDRIEDSDGTRLNIQTQHDAHDEKQFSQELRLAGTNDRFDWIAGAYFLRQNGRRVASYNTDAVPGTTLGFIVPTHLDARLTQDVQTTSFAPYIEGVFRFTDQLALRAGARYTWEKKKGFTEHLGVNRITTFPVEYNVDYGKSWEAFTPRAILEFKPADDIFLYAGASRGFKSGGYTLAGVLTAAAASTPYDPEYVWNYEIGARTQFFDRKVTANITLFDQRTDDLQVRSFVNTQFVFTNAGKARSRGVEVELSARPTEYFDFGLAYGYIDAKYSRFEGCAAGVDCSGNKFALVPAHTFSGYVGGRVPLKGNGELFGRLEGQFRSRIELNAQNNAPAPLLALTDNPGVFNLQLGWESEDKGWKITSWVRNLTDKRYVNFAVDLGIYYLDQIPLVPGIGTEAGEVVYRAIYNPGRTFGLTITKDF
jgi:iron complex outermembrane receptor protein